MPLDGRRVAAEIRAEVAAKAAALRKAGVVPSLVAVLMGDDPASAVYVRSKEKAAAEAGLASRTIRLPKEASEAELLATIHGLNEDGSVDAILVQLPLPRGIDTSRVVEAIDWAKDVDGFHPMNVGRLGKGLPAPAPCTPAGVMELLSREGIDLQGKNAVVVGRSDIVGKPMATLLLRANATVTIAHSKSRDLAALARGADILVAAIGRAGFVTGVFVKDGAVVVDVGINRITTREEVERFFPGDAGRKAELETKGGTLVGDCDPASVSEKASRLTPVPGGVGPLTIAMLLKNTVDLAVRRRGL
ncbi:MAG TPA: bifunctional 5,10-methylenetetrahydrofolate dehydrogenase/5,10-methenyltetrahydrofolate cyclohydrolase [Thermoanaerobaculia bacterium]|nr:bifunctional 5,10-methylenetetrahydrofolate dehydrogenase/5,10-methenyltetrahydrofolate cyclohydrolase [Thermoanaerobaculia bacterium]